MQAYFYDKFTECRKHPLHQEWDHIRFNIFVGNRALAVLNEGARHISNSSNF